MPLYEYKCKKCGLHFEELVSGSGDCETVKCRKCGFDVVKVVSRFSLSVAGGSPNESVDMTIGRDSEKRWQKYYDRQSKRRGSRELRVIDVPKSSDGYYQPVMALGSENDRIKRKDYVTALREHRRERIKKGIPQFSGFGEF